MFGDLQDEADADAILKKYDNNADGLMDFKRELEKLLQDREIINDLSKDMIRTLFDHLRERYDTNKDGFMSIDEFKRLAKDLRGERGQSRATSEESETPEGLYESGLKAHAETEKGLRHDDFSEAFELFRRAAEGNHPHGMHSFGAMHYYGRGCEVNLEEAEKWWRRAATSFNHASSAFNLGQILKYNDDGGAEAFLWMNRAAEWGSNAARRHLEK